MKILLIGYGRMGKLIASTAAAEGDEVVAAFGHDNLDRLAQTGAIADVVMDFSGPQTLPALCGYIRRTGTPLVSGTTGFTPEEKEQMAALGEYAPVLWSANYSIGIAVFCRLLTQITGILKSDFDIEISEIHHSKKTDAPSGTARLLLEAIDPGGALTPVYGRREGCGKRSAGEIGIHALRGGSAAGTHTVHFFGTDEELEITHRAASRQIFVKGALQMARLMPGRANGIYDLQKLLFGE